jgi:hypothetical protein
MVARWVAYQQGWREKEGDDEADANKTALVRLQAPTTQEIPSLICRCMIGLFYSE